MEPVELLLRRSFRNTESRTLFGAVEACLLPKMAPSVPKHL